jgi:hypothetical protein
MALQESSTRNSFRRRFTRNSATARAHPRPQSPIGPTKFGPGAFRGIPSTTGWEDPALVHSGPWRRSMCHRCPGSRWRAPSCPQPVDPGYLVDERTRASYNNKLAEFNFVSVLRTDPVDLSEAHGLRCENVEHAAFLALSDQAWIPCNRGGNSLGGPCTPCGASAPRGLCEGEHHRPDVPAARDQA